MNNLNNYDDYILDMILENIKNDETILLLSIRLHNIIESIDHPIAKKIIASDFNRAKINFKVTLLDINDKKGQDGKPILDSISFMTSNKAIESAAKEKNITLNKDIELTSSQIEQIYDYFLDDKSFNGKNRSETSLGRIINKLFPNEFNPNTDIEPFVNLYKSQRDPSDFKLVKGDDIIYWYNKDQYAEGGTLNGSCMRYDSCSEYLKFYSENPDKVSLLILKDKEDSSKIRGRAIVWNLDEPSGRTFMDRIYYTNDYIVSLFKDYAYQNGWIFKSEQNMNEDEDFIDSTNGEVLNNLNVKNLNDPGSGHYPYMDTLKYFDNSTISNNYDTIYDYIELTHTDGSAVGAGEYVEFYDEYIDTDDSESGTYCQWGDGWRYYSDCYYSDYYDEWITNDYAETNLTYCDYCDDDDDEYRRSRDCTEVSDGKYAANDYLEDNFNYSNYTNEWLVNSEFSDYYDTYIDADDAVEVYTDVEKSKTDWRPSDDGSWFEWDYDNEKYDNEITIEELKEENGLNKKRNIIKHNRNKRIKSEK